MKYSKPFSYFENKHNLKYPNNLIKIIDKIDGYLYFQTDFGLCKRKITSFSRGTYNIQSAVNKTEFTVNKLHKIYNTKYDYSLVKFNNSVKEKINLICKKHGSFETILRQAFFGKAICPICSKNSTKLKTTYTLERFIEIANKVHNFLYDYSITKYVISTEKIEINCLKHGVFKQKAQIHLQGHGCKKCANELKSKLNGENPTGWNYANWEKAGFKSKNFDSFKVYIIKCWNENEEFYKIGKTYRVLKERFGSKMTNIYNYEVINIIEGSARYISDLEIDLKNKNKTHKYIPKINFKGMYECFSEIEYLS